MDRRLGKTRRCIEQIPCEQFEADPVQWLEKQAQAHSLEWLLAYADDGVLWGQVRGGKLELSSDAFPEVSPILRSVTLQHLRLFGKVGELLLWRSDSGFKARLLTEGQGSQSVKYFDEGYLLWGTKPEGKPRNGFALLVEGSQGIRHAPPLLLDGDGTSQSRGVILVRHYLSCDQDGQMYIESSRLVCLQGGRFQ